MSNETSPVSVSRREFVAGTVVAAACLTCSGTPVLAAAEETTFTAGHLSKLKDGVNLVAPKKISLIKTDGKVYAQTAICTHKACSLKLAGEILKCGCHGSTFDLEGKATKGPAKDTLPRYGIELKGDDLIVDTSKIILPGEFEKEGAFVVVKGGATTPPVTR